MVLLAEVSEIEPPPRGGFLFAADLPFGLFRGLVRAAGRTQERFFPLSAKNFALGGGELLLTG